MKAVFQKIKRFLFSDIYQTINMAQDIINQYHALIKKQTLSNKKLNMNEIAILGNITNSKFTIKPQIYPRIVLSEMKLDSILNIDGSNVSLMNNMFTNQEISKQHIKAK